MATWEAANARAREYCAAASGTATVPRVVTSACDSEAPHYLTYVTERELALLLHFTAATPAGVDGPEGLLCAPPKTKRPKMGDLVVFSSTPVRHDGDDTDARGPTQPHYYYQDEEDRPTGLGAGENAILQRHTAENTVAQVVHYARRQGVGKWEVKVRPIASPDPHDVFVTHHRSASAPVRLWEQDFRPTYDDNDGLLPPVARLLDDHEAAQFKTRIPSLPSDVPDGGASGGGGATADLPQNANRDLVSRRLSHLPNLHVVVPRRPLRVGNPLAPKVGDYVASVPADRYGGYNDRVGGQVRKRKRLQRQAGMVAVVTEVTAAADRSTILEVRGRPIDADPDSSATDHYAWKALGHDFVPQELKDPNGQPSGELLPPIAKKLTEDEMRELLAG